ncbi:F-box/LRR-repeat protein [Trifolium repens]|nr:F-box/LRR-repeat protein [Trifolium repens]
MKRKRTSSSLNSSSSSSLQQTLVAATLPDECWETIFRFIINDDDDNDNRRYFNSLSLVSKQFLSITNRLIFSLTIINSTKDILGLLFKRFTNLNNLNLKGINIDNLLSQISYFPSKLTSISLSKVGSDLVGNISLFKNYTRNVDWVEALSLALIKLRKFNLSGFSINNKSLFHLFNNCKDLEEVVIFNCDKITNAGLASALRKRPTLKSLSFSISPFNPEYGQVFATSYLIDSLVSLKGLTCLVLHYLNISDELLYSIAREGLPLTRFDLQHCTGHSYAGIMCMLSKCRRIQHLDLQYTDFLNDQHVVEFSSFLVDLVSINLSFCLNLTKSALFTLAKNCPSLSEIKMENIGRKIEGRSDSLVEFGVYPQLKSLYLGNNSWLSDEIITIFASIFPNLQMLDLNSCHRIFEGICQVLSRCGKIRHLNLADCSKVKLRGVNFVVSKLEVLDLSNTDVDDETLYVISKNFCALLQLLLEQCNGVTEKGVKHVLENCTRLRHHGYILH